MKIGLIGIMLLVISGCFATHNELVLSKQGSGHRRAGSLDGRMVALGGSTNGSRDEIPAWVQTQPKVNKENKLDEKDKTCERACQACCLALMFSVHFGLQVGASCPFC